jgi:hypothetical protein
MKSKQEFNTQEEYREYLFQYYCPTCLLSVSHSALGGVNQYIAATNLAKELVNAVAPLEKDIPHPMKTSREEVLERIIPQQEYDRVVEANRKWYELHRGIGSNKVVTNPEIEGDMS